MKCNPCTKRLKLTRWKGKKRNKTNENDKTIVSLILSFFLFFSPQIANNLAEHSLYGAVQVANEISQFQQLKNNGESDEKSSRIIKTSDLISWSLQIARGMEFLASKKVTHFNVKYELKLNQTLLLYSTGSARRFSGPQCPFSRWRNRQSGRFRISQANGGLQIQEK